MSRRLAAIVVADVVGYSRLLAEDEAGTLSALKERRKAVVEPLVRQHIGRVVKFLGDGVLVEFASAVNAVAFALDVQRRMAEMNEPLPEHRRILLRIGINLGEVVGEGADIFGDGVNIAARLEAIAEPGGIAISGKVHDEVRGKLNIRAEDMGEVALRNILAPVRCWRVEPVPALEAAESIRPSGAGERITIAVLPFTNMSGDASQEYFADGLTEDLITALSKFRFFSVMSRNAAFQFKGRAVDIPTVGRQLGVRYVLEGSVRSGSSRLRITAQLIDIVSGAHVWAERFDRELADVFAVQDEIVTAISGQLFSAVIDAAVVSNRHVPATSLSAYDHVLRGRSAWRRGDVVETIRQYERAVQIDPHYATALACLGFVYGEETWLQVTGKPVAEARKLARELVDRAIASDEGDSFAHHMIGTAFIGIGDFVRAKEHLELALTLNPHYSYSTVNLGLTLAVRGSHREGLSLIEKAYRVEPRMGPAMEGVPLYVHCIMGDVDAAIADFERIKNPFACYHLLLAAVLAEAGRDQEAKRQLALFEEKRTPWYDVPAFAGWFDFLGAGEDRNRMRNGFRKLGFEV